jgi:hypothetical protein
MTGFIGSFAAFFLLTGFLLLFNVKAYQSSGHVCCFQALSLPIGIILGYIGKASSERMRDKFDVWYVSLYDFTKLYVVAFSFLGTFLYTVLIYVLDMILAAKHPA